ncbi:MAG: monofunctional biosynthetic peptidoglycan transglycosylase [Desulfobacteraceae bacterium]|nr:monofunctional biosynthetic peptidoglycan transglycosylase [Desulfobacteraceae bacterium]
MSKPKRKDRDRRRRWAARLGKGALAAAGALLALTLLQVALLRWWDPPFTVDMLWQACGGWLRSEPYRKPVWLWRDLERISPHLRKAVLAGEDQRFLRHEGFDFIEIRKAFGDLLENGRVRGASTISMQTARSVFLPRSRTVPRKLAEAYYTLLVEWMWGKRRILEIYLNTVDWGDGIQGAEAASRRYFRKPARDLTKRESALLASILPNPHLFPPDPSRAYVKHRFRQIRADMEKMPVVN